MFKNLNVLIDPIQCDQIWRNLATLAPFKKPWLNFEGLFIIWQNLNLTLAKNVLLLGKFSLLQIVIYLKIVQPSVTLLQCNV